MIDDAVSIAAPASSCLTTAELALTSAIQRSSRIATLPSVAVQIMRMCENPETELDDFEQIVDPVLGIRIIKLANSAYYGAKSRITSISSAIRMLGFAAVRNVALAASLVKMVRKKNTHSHFRAIDLWKHSIGVASCCRLLCNYTDVVLPDEGFLAGLIHDMGIVVLMQIETPQFESAIKALETESTLTFRQAEERMFNLNHETFGAALCETWGLPHTLTFSTGFHHRPWEIDVKQRMLPAIVHIADVMVANLKIGYSRTPETNQIDPELMNLVELEPRDLKRVQYLLPEAIDVSQHILSDDA